MRKSKKMIMCLLTAFVVFCGGGLIGMAKNGNGGPMAMPAETFLRSGVKNEVREESGYSEAALEDMAKRAAERTHVEIGEGEMKKTIDGVEYDVIRTAEELMDIEKGLDGNYILANDVVMGEERVDPIGFGVEVTDEIFRKESTFTGILDGNNYRIKNLYIETDGRYQYDNSRGIGLFEKVTGTLKNIILDKSCKIIGFLSVGGLAGVFGGIMDNCVNFSEVDGHNTVGGLVGTNGRILKRNYIDKDFPTTGQIINCVNYANMRNDFGGGIMGGYRNDTMPENGKYMENCFNYGNISGGTVVGGLAGLYPLIRNCINYGKVTSSNYGGGIVGMGMRLEDCKNVGEIRGLLKVGGVASGNGLTAINCVNEGDIYDNYEEMGGASENVGGIAPIGEFKNCINRGNIYATPGKYVGGITAYALLAENCQNYGEIKGKSVVAGIAAVGNTVENCENRGNVTGEYEYVGGIVGRLGGRIDDGFYKGTINKSYNYGVIRGNGAHVGGVVGYYIKEDLITDPNSDKLDFGKVTDSKNYGKVINKHAIEVMTTTIIVVSVIGVVVIAIVIITIVVVKKKRRR